MLPDLFNHDVLMCWPKHYNVNYSINPWMHLQDPSDDEYDEELDVNWPLAVSQWINFHHTLINLGAFVHYVEPAKTLPDMVFTANAGLVVDKKVIISNFKYRERRPEKRRFKRWFEEAEYEVVEIENKYGSFEGSGDGLFCGDIYFAGYGIRSDLKAQRRVAELIPTSNVVYCKLVDPSFYHLDTCFCPLRRHSALVYPDAFDLECLAVMDNTIQMIPVPPQEARKFACNAVILGNDIIMPQGCPLTRERLIGENFRVYEVNMSEFIKAGGACKCLTLGLP